MTVTVHSVSTSPQHAFSSARQPQIRLLVGLSVEGEAYAGVTVQHLLRVRRNSD
ncbi:hypothetical protein GCM10010840_12310 [Deinococcus aerolatus]|uniref:Uncharacterized protein n=1 Tax=Deinococcus aerolatus TaxID=522487 RepID=A0ABQ2G5M2_9DEIO|nr:hypothetical protein [Deinococcus aerolatus]GGL75724.1 hypothetical protein GCM10010840_12310 [Deinococcus aerolatus]